MVPKSGAEILRDNTEITIHNQYQTPGIRTLKEGQQLREYDEAKLLRAEIPKSPEQLLEEQIRQAAVNIAAMRSDKLQKFLRKEQELYGEYIAAAPVDKDQFGLAGNA
jgi:hypothetical protein